MIHVIDRYGEAIEADLHSVYGVDLLDFFRGVFSWRKLQVLIDGLPGSSRFSAARIDDDEAAELYLASLGGKEPPPQRPRIVDEDMHAALLRAVVNHLGAVVDLLNKQDPAKRAPLLGPVTAIERQKLKASLTRHRSLVDEVREAQKRWEEANQ